jgi:hypothetical protein
MYVINVRCHESHATQLAEAVAAARAEEREWRQARRHEIYAAAEARLAAGARLTAADRSRIADQLAGEHAQQRRTGRLRGTRTAYLMPALVEVLIEHDWVSRAWKPVPPTRPGRPWGTHDAGFTHRVVLQLPDDLGETLTRACHWASQPAIRRLQAWYDRHGDHWRGQRHDPRPRWTGLGPSSADLAEREALVDQVWTIGRIVRKAMNRALNVGD